MSLVINRNVNLASDEFEFSDVPYCCDVIIPAYVDAVVFRAFNVFFFFKNGCGFSAFIGFRISVTLGTFFLSGYA